MHTLKLILYEAIITLTTNPVKDNTRKLHVNILGECGYKNPQENISKLNSIILSKGHTP